MLAVLAGGAGGAVTGVPPEQGLTSTPVMTRVTVTVHVRVLTQVAGETLKKHKTGVHIRKYDKCGGKSSRKFLGEHSILYEGENDFCE